MTDGGDLIGKTLGKCRIRGKLGYGQTATIFRAFYEPLGKEVAVKILKKDAKATEELRQKFINEAKSLARLDHQNIVKVYDVVEEGDYLFIIMELLVGKDLWQIMKKEGPFEASRAIDIIVGATQALMAAHAEGIIHRDIKPQNIMLVGRREKVKVKLVDFGLASEGAVIGKAGTPLYMSPEQIQGKRVEAKSDVYSLGATFFHILTGAPPYPGQTRKEIFEKVLAGQSPTASKVDREMHLPKAVDPVVKRMMAPVPGYRYSAKDLADALASLNLAAGGKQRHRHAAKAAVSRQKGVPKVLIGVAIGVVVLAAALAVVLFTSKKAPPPSERNQTAGQPGTPDPAHAGIEHRADDRAARENRASAAFRQAQNVEARNPNDYAAVIDAYRQVWENPEFGGTVWDEKARERMKQLETARDEEKRRSERLEKEQKRDAAMAAFKADVKKLVDTYQFAAAREKIHDFMFEYGETKDLAMSSRRLEHADRCIAALIEDVNANDRKMNLGAFMEKAPDGAKLESMDESGITVKTGSTERKEEWTFLKPVELRNLINKQTWSRDPLKLFYAHCLFAELGFDRDAEAMLDYARVTDEFGRISQLEKELAGK
jgi:tRNA A-37 threonylcarbamoyl transferase component Bud32